jgi:hypothetical protein
MTRTELTYLIRKLHRRRKIIAEAKELEDCLSAHLTGRNCAEVRIPVLKAVLVGDEIYVGDSAIGKVALNPNQMASLGIGMPSPKNIVPGSSISFVSSCASSMS